MFSNSSVHLLTWPEDSAPCSTWDTVHLCRWTSCRSYIQLIWLESGDRIFWSETWLVNQVTILSCDWSVDCLIVGDQIPDDTTLSCSAPVTRLSPYRNTWAQHLLDHRRTSCPCGGLRMCPTVSDSHQHCRCWLWSCPGPEDDDTLDDTHEDTHDNSTNLFVHPVLVNGPDSGNMSVEELGQSNLLIASSGADESRLAHSIVPHQHTLHQLSPGLLILHPETIRNIFQLHITTIYNHLTKLYFLQKQNHFSSYDSTD